MGTKGGIPIYAGVHGTFDGRGSAFGPNRVDVVLGDYRIIYGHVANPSTLPVGARVTPDTIVGEMDFGERHMHLEIRYRNQYILNPFLFMSETMRNSFISEFPPEGDYAFYTSTRWQRWDSPLDQPTIVLGGPVIGPRA